LPVSHNGHLLVEKSLRQVVFQATNPDPLSPAL
jgi:hypothetical protein